MKNDLRGSALFTNQEKLVTARGLTFSLKTWGDPHCLPTLALHGWMDNANSFDKLAPELTDTYFCALDMAGHGFSDHRPPGSFYYVTDYIFDAIAVADRMNWSSFNLLGHSLGANVSLLLAGIYPERVERLVLIEGFGPHTRQPDMTATQLRSAFVKSQHYREDRRLLYPSWDAIVEKRMLGGTVVSRDAAETLCRRGVKEISGGWVWRSDPRLRYASPLRFSEEEILAVISEVEASTSLILGESGLPEAFLRVDERKDKLSDLIIRKLPGNHHLHMEDRANDVANIINDFIGCK